MTNKIAEHAERIKDADWDRGRSSTYAEIMEHGVRLAIDALRERAKDVEPHSYTTCRVIREEAAYLEYLLSRAQAEGGVSGRD